MTIKSPFNVMKFYYTFPENAPKHHEIHELRRPSAPPGRRPRSQGLALAGAHQGLSQHPGTADRWRGGKFGGKKPGDVMEKMWNKCGKNRGKTWKQMWKHHDKMWNICGKNVEQLGKHAKTCGQTWKKSGNMTFRCRSMVF